MSVWLVAFPKWVIYSVHSQWFTLNVDVELKTLSTTLDLKIQQGKILEMTCMQAVDDAKQAKEHEVNLSAQIGTLTRYG